MGYVCVKKFEETPRKDDPVIDRYSDSSVYADVVNVPVVSLHRYDRQEDR